MLTRDLFAVADDLLALYTARVLRNQCSISLRFRLENLVCTAGNASPYDVKHNNVRLSLALALRIVAFALALKVMALALA